jgi:hypothetical protein
MKSIFTSALLLLALAGSVPAFADGGEGNNYYPDNNAPQPIRVINWGRDVGPAPSCQQGFEAVYDVGYGRWTCVPITNNGGGGGN